MLNSLLCVAVAALAMSSGAAVTGGLKMAVGAYVVSGVYNSTPPTSISGTGAIGQSGASGTHTSTTPSNWGTDDLTWDAAQGAYRITDGETHEFIAWLVVDSYDPVTKSYSSHFEDANGNSIGSEKWTEN